MVGDVLDVNITDSYRENEFGQKIPNYKNSWEFDVKVSRSRPEDKYEIKENLKLYYKYQNSEHFSAVDGNYTGYLDSWSFDVELFSSRTYGTLLEFYIADGAGNKVSMPESNKYYESTREPNIYFHRYYMENDIIRTTQSPLSDSTVYFLEEQYDNNLDGNKTVLFPVYSKGVEITLDKIQQQFLHGDTVHEKSIVLKHI